MPEPGDRAGRDDSGMARPLIPKKPGTAMQAVEGIDLSGKTCVVTGASSGLGRESARALAAAGARCSCRS